VHVDAYDHEASRAWPENPRLHAHPGRAHMDCSLDGHNLEALITRSGLWLLRGRHWLAGWRSAVIVRRGCGRRVSSSSSVPVNRPWFDAAVFFEKDSEYAQEFSP
jgi:hypothetical protein